MLTMIIHPMLRNIEGTGFARFLAAILPDARRAPLNYICVIGLVVAPTVALVALGTADRAGRAGFALTAAGLAFAVAGPLLVSNRLAEPNYDVILAWDGDLPSGWEQAQRRYFTLNWVRAGATWIAFGLFLAAFVEVM
jgi:hypothetical protein